MRCRFLAALLALAPLSAGALELEFDKVVAASGEDFTFTTVFNDPVTSPPVFSRDVQRGSSPSYQIWVDPEKVEGTRFGFFRYIVYARKRTEPTKFTEFTIQGVPAGAFDDQLARVRFSIGEAAPFEEGFVDVPIFGSLAPAAVSGQLLNKSDEPVDVDLSSARDIPISLTNQLGGMPVAITAVSASANDADLWRVLEVRGQAARPFAPFDLQRGQTAPAALVLRLQPSNTAAATALIRGKKKEDDTITMTVSYKTPARTESSTTIPVRVHFVPWPPSLLLVTLIGAGIGSLVPVTVKRKRQDWRDRMRVIGAAASVAVLVELIGMLLFLGDSELRILGVALDPFQMLTALLIGVLSGLTGLQSLRFLQRLGKQPFWKFGKSEEPESA